MPSPAPAPRTTGRRAWMTRPRLPIRRPISAGLAWIRSCTSSRRSVTSISTASGSSATWRVTCSTTARARAPRIRFPSGAISSSYSSSSSSRSSSITSGRSSNSSLMGRLFAGVVGAGVRGRFGVGGGLRLRRPDFVLSLLGFLRGLLRRALRIAETAAGELRVDRAVLLGLELRPNTRGHQQLLDLLGGLRTLAQPGQRLLPVDVDERRILAGAVVADRLDVAAVAGGAGIGDDDAVRRLLRLAHPHQAGLHGHVRRSSRGRDRAPGDARRPHQASDSRARYREPRHLALTHRSHHLLDHLELLEHAVDVLRGRATTPCDPEAPRAVDDRRVAPLLG